MSQIVINKKFNIKLNLNLFSIPSNELKHKVEEQNVQHKSRDKTMKYT